MISPQQSQRFKSQNCTEENFHKKQTKPDNHNQNMDKLGYTTGTLSIANGIQGLGLNPSTLKGKL